MPDLRDWVCLNVPADVVQSHRIEGTHFKGSSMRFISSFVAIILIFSATATVHAEVKTASASGEIAPKPMPSPKQPAADEKATVEVQGVKFFQRFNRGEFNKKTHLGTGGFIVNGGAAELSVRVCIAFYDADENLITVETLDQTVAAGGISTVLPLRKVPADQIDKITHYRATLHVSDKRFL